MVLVEFRVPLPLSVDEFQVAQLYMVVKASEENTKGDEGVVWLVNEPYDNTDGHMGVSPFTGTEVPRNAGQYTRKLYHLKSRVPAVVKALVPKDALVLVEEAWNAYPRCRTVLTNGYLDKRKFKIDIDSMHLPDNGTTENALGLSEAELKEREVRRLDVATAYDKTAKDYDARYDSSVFHSEKTGRGPLAAGWSATPPTPVMCCYKLVRADFKYWGMQGKVESTIVSQQNDLFAKSLSASFCMIDGWHGMTMADIRALEARQAEELAKAGLTADKKATGEDMEAEGGGGSGGAGAGGAAAPAPAV